VNVCYQEHGTYGVERIQQYAGAIPIMVMSDKVFVRKREREKKRNRIAGMHMFFVWIVLLVVMKAIRPLTFPSFSVVCMVSLRMSWCCEERRSMRTADISYAMVSRRFAPLIVFLLPF
jgi:hypothetical protein